MPQPTLSVKKKAGSRLVRKQNNNTIGLGVAHEEVRQELADAAAEAIRRKELQELLEKITVGKPSCPKPVIGMRVKLSDHVPGFIRDLSEPAHANKYGGYARPPPLIGTIVRVVGDPLEQKRAHSFKYKRCGQSMLNPNPIAMWCDVRWDAPRVTWDLIKREFLPDDDSGQEVTCTGYNTGRFGLHYLLVVDEKDDPNNDPKNIRLRQEKAKRLEHLEAIAAQVRERASPGKNKSEGEGEVHLPEVNGAVPRPTSGASSSSGKSRSSSASSVRTVGSGYTPRYWADSQASTEQRSYHSKEALEAKLDPDGLDKMLERMVVADKFWTNVPAETPGELRLRRYSAGSEPSSSSLLAQTEITKSRPSSRRSIGSGTMISKDYDIFAEGASGHIGMSINDYRNETLMRPTSHGSVGSDVSRKPSTPGTAHPVHGILRPMSSNNAIDASRPVSPVRFYNDEDMVVDPDADPQIQMMRSTSSRGSVLSERDSDSTSSPRGMLNTGSWLDNRPSSVVGSRPTSRAIVRFSDGGIPGISEGHEEHYDDGDATFEFEMNRQTMVLHEIPSSLRPISSDSEDEQGL